MIVHNVYTGDGERDDHPALHRTVRSSATAAAPAGTEPPSRPTVHLANCDLCASRIHGPRYVRNLHRVAVSTHIDLDYLRNVSSVLISTHVPLVLPSQSNNTHTIPLSRSTTGRIIYSVSTKLVMVAPFTTQRATNATNPSMAFVTRFVFFYSCRSICSPFCAVHGPSLS